ncbi:proliferating cell nuclear antigen (pcna) [Candidatus Bathyarchaeota archaeon]|nr:proliferating cell nuclear antigen (pcna) [Candidatus Bathyarchaeota archaeon]MBS7629490.1 proliferating cell nuclear antigen (pcna) [Candidatus Bathyarchaeota archaeon]
MFRVVFQDAKTWRNLMTAISTLIEEADFNATDEGLKLRSMDPSHVAMVDFYWPKEAFEEYVCEKPTVMRVSLTSMLKLLRRSKSEESLVISYDEESRKINLNLKGKISKNFIMPTLEPTEEEVPTPKISFNAKIRLMSETLKEIVEDSEAVSDNIRLEATQDSLLVKASSELSSLNMELTKDDGALIEIDVKENSTATFNLNYLGEMVKAGSATSEVASLEFSTNMPIRLEFEMPQQGRLTYYLAPRIEAE